MLDHLSIRTSPELHEATVAFYVAALAPLGYTQIVNMFDGKLVAFGATSPDFWISAFPPPDTTETKLSNAHFAFRAKDQAAVDTFFAKGLDAGGKDNGKPGLRPEYGPAYYGGFLYDPVGNSVEAVHGRG